MASFVKNALYLRKVVAMDERFGCRRVKGGEDAIFFEVGVEALLDVDRFDGFVFFLAEFGGKRKAVLLGCCWAGNGGGGEGEAAIAQFHRLQRTDNLKGTKAIAQNMRQPALDSIVRIFAFLNLQLTV